MRSINKIILSVGFTILTSSTLIASPSAKELFTQKCTICHSMTRPADKSQMLAPPARGLMFHMSESIGSDEKILAHIKSFAINPSKEKAICKSVKRFGLMPSQKDNITPEELNIVAKWMIENLKMTKKEHQKRKNRGNR